MFRSFLFFNFGKASIFMGSSGSYVIGSLMYFNSTALLNQTMPLVYNSSKFSLLFSFIAIPLYDTLRVFFLRVLQKKSPFSADANHVHHRLLILLPSHSSVVYLLLLINLLLVGLNIIFSNFFDILILFCDLMFLLLCNFYLEYRISKKTIHFN